MDVKKRSSRQQTCVIFHSKSGEEQKNKVITSAGEVFQTISGSLKCASGSLRDQRVNSSQSLIWIIFIIANINYIWIIIEKNRCDLSQYFCDFYSKLLPSRKSKIGRFVSFATFHKFENLNLQ